MNAAFSMLTSPPPHLQRGLQDGARLPLRVHVSVRQQPREAVREAEGRGGGASGSRSGSGGREAGMPALLGQGDSLPPGEYGGVMATAHSPIFPTGVLFPLAAGSDGARLLWGS